MGNRFKFLTDNFLLDCLSVAASSEDVAFPAGNILSPIRSKVWRTTGNFIINGDNDQFIVNDGADKTITLTHGEYASGSALATHIQSKLNVASSNFTVAYSLSRFVISRTSSFNITWINAGDTLGFAPLTVLTALQSYSADDFRICWPEENITIDMGISRLPKAIVILDNKAQESTEIKLKANEGNNWNSPQSITISYNKANLAKIDMNGLFYKAFRYFRVSLADINNLLRYIQAGKIYIGEAFELESSNVQREFPEELEDLSSNMESIGGEEFSDIRPSHSNFKSVLIEYCNKNDVDRIWATYDKFRTHTPFFISIDSEATVTNNVNEWTKYVRFSGPPERQTVANNIWNVRMSFKEVL
jgi:hypothetical protein